MSHVAFSFIQEQEFLDATLQAIDTHKIDRVILSQYKGELADLEKITLRLIQLQNETMLNAVYRYKTQDITKNYAISEAETVISAGWKITE